MASWIRRGREEGAVAIMIALLLVVFLAAVALAVDVGGLYLRRRALVNGADAAALSAARTCARGGYDTGHVQPGNAVKFFATPEEAADYQVQQNSPITGPEVAGTNITAMPPQCGLQYGHVSVQYTSQQSLYFAPVIGFNNSSPVTTAATASWGLGSVNSVPLILSKQLYGTCPAPPPTGTAADWTNVPGQQCGIWYDNDTLNNGNFGFLTLDPAGWNTPPGDVPSDCQGSTPGSSTLGDWISGKVPTSVTLNWLDPTYVCNATGLKGNSNPWVALQQLANQGAIRDFPITWEGPGSPGFGAPPQGYVLHSGTILKYDVIGFAALKIDGVYTVQQAQGTVSTTQEPWNDYTFDDQGITLTSTLPAGSMGTYVWSGHQTTGQGGAIGPNTCSFTTGADKPAGPYTWKQFSGNAGGQCPGSNEAVDTVSSVTVTYPVTTTTYGPCGPPPPGSSGNGNSSARCVVVEWRGSTLTDDYSQPKDNITVVRLCDYALGNCLDQNPNHP
jgi:hypothetical protein